jgi:hypothetical protein
MDWHNEVISAIIKIIIADLRLIATFYDIILINHKFYNIGFRYRYDADRQINNAFTADKLIAFIAKTGDRLFCINHAGITNLDMLLIQCSYCKYEYRKTRIATIRDCFGGCDTCREKFKN